MARPKQVQAQAAQAKRIREQMAAQAQAAPGPNGADPDPGVAAPEPAPEPEPALQAAPEPADEPETAPPPADPPIDWEARYRTLEGKYAAEVPRLQSELNQTQHLLTTMQPDPEPLMDPNLSSDFTPEEIEEFGPQLIGAMRKAARSEIKPLAQQLEGQQQRMQEGFTQATTDIAQTSRDALYGQMNSDPEMSGWAQVNKSQEFLDWLGQRDIYSGQSKQDLLTQAFERNDFLRIKAFFTGFHRDTTRQTGQEPARMAQSNLETLVAPGRPAQSGTATGASNGRIWTQAEISAAFRARQSGKIDDKTWPRVKADIFAAERENRIRL